MRIAVTGSAGFLGRQVATSLRAAGHEVVGLDVVPHDGGAVVDLQDAGATRVALEGVEGVVHLAGYPRAGSHAPHDVFTTNTSISFSVVDAAVEAGVSTFAFGSSISTIGYPFFVRPIPPAHLPLDESIDSMPQDSYGLSKLVGESIIDSAIARAGGSLAAVSLRFPALHSPQSFVAEMPGTYEAGKDVRLFWSYIDIRDAGDAFAAVFARDNTGHTKLFLAAADTFDPRPTADLLAEHYPDAPLTRPLGRYESLLDSTAAIAYLGFRPGISWRSYDGTAGR
jgi:nucleoside-diphosphate-sugar epimerase